MPLVTTAVDNGQTVQPRRLPGFPDQHNASLRPDMMTRPRAILASPVILRLFTRRDKPQSKEEPVSCYYRPVAWPVPIMLAVAASSALPDGFHGGPGPYEPATRFERVILRDCQLCVQETYTIGTVSMPPVRLAGVAPQVTSAMRRNGEVRLELVRGYRPGRADDQFALRINLVVLSGGSPPITYRFASGLVDEEDLPALAIALPKVVSTLQTLLRPGPAATDTAEIQLQAGSIRIGGFVTQAGAVAYVQATERETVPAPSPWESVSALFLQPDTLPALGQLIASVMQRIQELRSR